MKRLRIKSIRLCSRREKSAQKIEFDSRLTVIMGANDTGKSSLMKSIYWTFGAEPAVVDPNWEALDIVSAVEFEVSGTPYNIIRHNDRVAIFDGQFQLLLSTTKLTSVLGPYLGDLLGFHLVLTSRQGRPEVPPPAFAFLPSYIDQDKGWVSAMTSFKALGQYSDWQKDVIEYHVGLHTNDYFRVKSDVKEKQAQLTAPTQLEAALRKTFEEIRSGFDFAGVTFDIDQFSAEIEDLLEEAKPLGALEESLRVKGNQLGNRRLLLQHQLAIVERTISELAGDFEESLQQPDDVECPTCGAHYSNSIGERFHLVMDGDECGVIANDIRQEIKEIDDELAEFKTKLEEARSNSQRIWSLLEVRKGQFTLKELIAGEGRREAIKTIKAQLDQTTMVIARLQKEIAEANRELKKYTDPKRRKSYLSEFSDLIGSYCVKLNVESDKVVKFHHQLRVTGSDTPRGVLANTFAVLGMKRRHSDSPEVPLVIDSPNQQDQDAINLKSILEFIRDETPEDAQLVLGLVDTHGVQFKGKTVQLTYKKALLRPDQYATVGRDLEILLGTMYAS